MAKDTFWFTHDSNASRDIKLMQIKHMYDFWGIGVYWSVIEVLREQPDYKFSATESGIGLLSSLVMCSDTIRFSNWFNDCIRVELFRRDGDAFFSPSLRERMRFWDSKKVNGSKGGRPKKTEPETETKPTALATENNNRIEQNRIEQNSVSAHYVSFDHLSMTVEEFNRLIEKGYSKDAIDSMVLEVKNYRNNKKYKELYLTVLNWLKKEEDGKPKKGEMVF